MGKIILAIAAILVGVLGTLTILVAYAAGAANQKPEDLVVHYRWMRGLGIFGLLSLVSGVALLWFGRPGWAAIVGVLPMAVVIIAMVWLTISSIK